jgi:hypothetical protein
MDKADAKIRDPHLRTSVALENNHLIREIIVVTLITCYFNYHITYYILYVIESGICAIISENRAIMI